MKHKIMSKLFIGNLLIFLFLLIIQYTFQTVFFEAFLIRTQNNRLVSSIDRIHSSIEQKDEAEVRRLVNQEADRGIVIVALDQELNQIFGQSFDQYQHCFTLENDQKEQYIIIEDYMESIPLQSIAVGDVVSVEGYLVDEHNGLVIPSKVYRTKDGVVLGSDTFLFVNRSDEAEKNEDVDPSVPQSGVVVSSEPGIAMSDETTTSNGAEGASQDESNLPRGFVLQSPYDIPGSNDQNGLSGSTFSGTDQDTTIRDERMLIIEGGDRNGSSFPIVINGTVIDHVDLSNNDLLIQQGLIADEIDRISATTTQTARNEHETMTAQLTTGKYLLCVSRLSQSGVTVIGAISLYSIQDMNHMMNTFHAWLFLAELGLVACGIYYFSRIISKPLIQMNGVALKIAHQDFSSRVNVTTDDEVGMLGGSINEISINLEQKIQTINQMNDRLRQDYERQLALQERHKQLSAAFSHEMKTPLTILRGYIDGMQSGLNPEKHAEHCEIALRELDSASSLISQMLEIARMESPYFAPKMKVVDLWMIFFQVYDELKQTIDKKGMQMEYYMEDEANTRANAELMEKVISNVLTNALKYSPRGSRISIRISSDCERHIFYIENENANIPEEQLEKVWLPFYRVEKSNESAASGTGLGLMIVSEILQLHAFEYGIRNTGRGVEFHFSCPAISAAEQENMM